MGLLFGVPSQFDGVLRFLIRFSAKEHRSATPGMRCLSNFCIVYVNY